jgi:hypothetical protein
MGACTGCQGAQGALEPPLPLRTATAAQAQAQARTPAAVPLRQRRQQQLARCGLSLAQRATTPPNCSSSSSRVGSEEAQGRCPLGVAPLPAAGRPLALPLQEAPALGLAVPPHPPPRVWACMRSATQPPCRQRTTGAAAASALPPPAPTSSTPSTRGSPMPLRHTLPPRLLLQGAAPPPSLAAAQAGPALRPAHPAPPGSRRPAPPPPLRATAQASLCGLGPWTSRERAAQSSRSRRWLHDTPP